MRDGMAFCSKGSLLILGAKSDVVDKNPFAAPSGKGTATVGYNVQIAVDAEHHLIVAHEVTNQGYDRHQLAPMAFKAQQATGCEQITRSSLGQIMPGW